MAFFAVQAIIAIGLLLLARLFLKGPGEQIAKDDRPTTLANRGDYCPYIMGAWSTGYLFCWAGDDYAFTRSEEVGGSSGGKGLGGGGSTAQEIWFMPAWHMLGHQLTRLNFIDDGGQIVWQGNLNRETTPSGSTIDAGDVGIFRIYWGEWDQPVDPDLAAKIGIASRWPGRAYIYWVEKRLSTSRQWPQLNYHREHGYVSDTLSSPYMLDNGVYRGVNGMHALLQLLAGIDPYGLAIAGCDNLSAEAVAQRCEEEGLACNFVIENGDNVDRAIQGLLLDLGVQMPDHKGALVFMLNRHDDDAVPVLDEGVVLAPEQEITVRTDEGTPNRITYSFKDKNNRWRSNDIKFDEAGLRDQVGHWIAKSYSISSVSDLSVAQTIANRRISEAFGDDATFKIEASRGGLLLLPGSPFQLSDGTPLRVTGVQRDTISPKASIDCVLDAYSVTPDDLILDESNTPPVVTGGAAARDQAFTFFQVPASMTSGGPTIKIVVLRIRAHMGISGAILWASADAAAYNSVGSQNNAASGGLLEESIASTTASPIEDGPLIEALNADIERVQDLTSDPANHEAGSQLCFINNEAFFLRNVTAQSEVEWAPSHAYAVGASVIPTTVVTGLRYVCIEAGTSGAVEPTDWTKARLGLVVDGTTVWQARGFRYRLHGLIRARYDTAQGTHTQGDVAYIQRSTSLLQITAPIFTVGRNLCIKTQPFTSSGNTALSAVSPVCKTLE